MNVILFYDVKNAPFWRLKLKAQITVLAHHWTKHSLSSLLDLHRHGYNVAHSHFVFCPLQKKDENNAVNILCILKDASKLNWQIKEEVHLL